MAKMLSGEERDDNTHLRTQEYTWPRQERPHAPAWRTWRKAITTIISTTSGKLHQPLGEWNHDHETSWNYLISNTTQKLYHYTQNGWRCHNMTRNGRIKKYDTANSPSQLSNSTSNLMLENSNKTMRTRILMKKMKSARLNNKRESNISNNS